jgi:hypothetical protein
VNHNRYPLPLFFVSVDTKQFSLPVSPLDATFMGGHVSVASKEVIYSKMVQRAVCFVSVADRGLRPKSRLWKAKTPARWLALSVSGDNITQKTLYAETLFLSIENWKNRGGRPRRNGGGKSKS